MWTRCVSQGVTYHAPPQPFPRPPALNLPTSSSLVLDRYTEEQSGLRVLCRQRKLKEKKKEELLPYSPFKHLSPPVGVRK